MRGVNREGLTEGERRRERREALNLPSRVQRGRKYPRKRMSVCVCVCVSNKGEKTTHLNVRYREAWHGGKEGGVRGMNMDYWDEDSIIFCPFL